MKNLVIKKNFRIFSKFVMKACGVFNFCVYCISPTLHNPMDCNLPGSSVHGISQARILEWVTILFSRGSSWPRDQTWDSCIAGRFFTLWTTREALFNIEPVSSVQSLSHVWLFAAPWTAACQSSLSITNSQSLLKLISIESVMPSNHLILLSPSPPAFNLYQHQFQWVSSLQHVAKVLEFQLQHQSNEHPGLISFRMDWLDLLALQGTLKSLLQHHSSKASILQCSAFFIVQLSHPYMTTGKTIALTRRTFVGKVMSLLFNMLSRLVIAFLPRSKRLLISWLQSPSALILETPKMKSVTVSTVSPYICHEVMGLDAILVFWMLSECWVLSQLFHSPLSLSSKDTLVLLWFLP